MTYIIYCVKGFFIGIAKLLPGVSGAMLAMSLGLYEQAIHAIRHFFDDVKSHTLFLGSIGIGVVISIIFFSHVIEFMLNRYYLTTMLLFIGLILGGIPSIYKKARESTLTIWQPIIFVIAFLFVFMLTKLEVPSSDLSIMKPATSFLLMVVVGLIDAFTMVIPGISGTAVFMILGLYPIFLSMLQKLGSLSMILSSLGTFFPYGVGLLVGILLSVFIMDHLFRKHQATTYYGILGFSISSLLFLFFETLMKNYTVTDVVAGLMCLLVGYYFGHKFE